MNNYFVCVCGTGYDSKVNVEIRMKRKINDNRNNATKHNRKNES